MAYGKALGALGCSGRGKLTLCPLEGERTVHSSSVSNYWVFFKRSVSWSFPPPLLEGPVGRLVPSSVVLSSLFCMYLLMLVTFN